MCDSLGPLLDDLAGDERSVLLTLARMVITCDTGAGPCRDVQRVLYARSVPGSEHHFSAVTEA